MFNLKYKDKHPGRTSAKQRRDLRRFEKKLKVKLEMIEPNFSECQKQTYMDLMIYGQAKVFVGFKEHTLTIRNVSMEDFVK